MENLVKLDTQEINANVSISLIEAASSQLQEVQELSEVNLVLKNWDTSKVSVFEKAIFLGIETKESAEQDGTVRPLKVVIFMDSEKNIWYKAAFNFVKVFESGMIKPAGAFRAEFLGLEKLSNGNKAETFKVQAYK